MKKTRYTEEQIAFALRQTETGTPVGEVIRTMCIFTQTFYRWKKQYGQMGMDEIQRLKQLKEENRKLKQLVADLSLDKLMLQDVRSKKALRPGRRRELVRDLEGRYGESEWRSCRVLLFFRSSHR
jgi:putative transposase